MDERKKWYMDDQIRVHIEVRCWKEIKLWNFEEQEFEDLKQQCWLSLVKAESKYDSNLSKPITFASTVVENTIRSLNRDKNTLKRRPRSRQYRFSQWKLDPKTQRNRSVMDMADEQRDNHRLQSELRSHIESADQRMDVESLLGRLSSHEEQLFRLIAEEGLSAASRELGIGRDILRKERDRIRAKFREEES
jgi:RNA polymerase sigma factor (sigma-70 family)